MKHKKIAFAWIGILMIVVFSMSGCKSESNGKSAANTATPTPSVAVKTDDMVEQWVYIHDRTVPAMILYKDGTLKEVIDASEILHMTHPAKDISKYYLCYKRF